MHLDAYIDLHCCMAPSLITVNSLSGSLSDRSCARVWHIAAVVLLHADLMLINAAAFDSFSNVLVQLHQIR